MGGKHARELGPIQYSPRESEEYEVITFIEDPES
jgi:hypothetical protein